MRLALAVSLVMCLCLSACSVVSRESSLRARAGEVEKRLLAEQAKAAALPTLSPDREPKLSHLTSLRQTLSAVNIARGAVKSAVPVGFRDVAYDAVEEAYANIEWNIPLMPSESKGSLPFSIQPDGSFNMNALGATSPASQPPGIR
jgi:hypothetical protein